MQCHTGVAEAAGCLTPGVYLMCSSSRPNCDCQILPHRQRAKAAAAGSSLQTHACRQDRAPMADGRAGEHEEAGRAPARRACDPVSRSRAAPPAPEAASVSWCTVCTPAHAATNLQHQHAAQRHAARRSSRSEYTPKQGVWLGICMRPVGPDSTCLNDVCALAGSRFGWRPLENLRPGRARLACGPLATR